MVSLSNAQPVSAFKRGGLWTIYGKSGSGKTALAATFPKPLLFVMIGDEGLSTIKNVEGAAFLKAETLADLRDILEQLEKDKKYKTVVLDTFGLVVNMWIKENSLDVKKSMTQQKWGDLKNDLDELLRQCQKLAKNKLVVLTIHEIMDAIEGLEDEIIPDIRPNVNKGTRSYLEGMSNFGIHTTKMLKTITGKDGLEKEVTKYGVHLGANPFYWTKLQVDPSVKLPKILYNPSYDKIMELIGENDG